MLTGVAIKCSQLSAIRYCLKIAWASFYIFTRYSTDMLACRYLQITQNIFTVNLFFSKSALMCFVQTIHFSSVLRAVWFIETSFSTANNYSVALNFTITKLRVIQMRNQNDTSLRANIRILFVDHIFCWQYSRVDLQSSQNIWNVRQSTMTCQSTMHSLIRNISSIGIFPDKFRIVRKYILMTVSNYSVQLSTTYHRW